MSKKTEALKLAMDALEYISSHYMSLPKIGCMALAAGKEALAEQPAQPYPDNFIHALMYDVAKRDSEAQQPVVEHPPCQGMNCGITRTDQEHSLECQAENAAAIAGGAFVKPAQQQEPVATYQISMKNGATSPAWVDVDEATYNSARMYNEYKCRVLYTSPPASKPWVGLTDEEMRDLEKQFNAERVRTSDEEYLIIYPGDYWQWQRAIEAKLRKKNA